ncbi:hypothetical protein Tsubulata_026309 [Turnera subulata]|uniref:OBG-type G domain-containing protein n=1 Tax=Turnera subulata TaxID=218843 RepID=A0A9Q0JKT8_9ROSI|nr:hypothetical protein Tsubulata_026309 [Turnera subulata]
MWLRCSKPISQLEAVLRQPWKSSPWMLSSSFCSYLDSAPTISKATPLQETRMRDRVRLQARGGDGGSGCTSFRRSRHVRYGKPDGGDGGRGGDVILEGSKSIWDLRGLQPHANAGKGGHGASKNMIGTRGADKVLRVPIGTVIHLVNGDLPSVIEYSSTKDLDPWDLPGSLDGDQAKYFPHSEVKNLNMTEQVESLQSAGGRSLNSEELAGFQSTLGSKGEQVESLQSASGRLMDAEELAGAQCPLVGSKCGQVKSLHSAGGRYLDSEEGDATKSTLLESESVPHIQYNVAELTKHGQRIVVARGGEGGLGNLSLYVSKKSKLGKIALHADEDSETSNEDQPSLSAGLPGSEAVLILELKSIADVGLVGMPNAGKSTLLGSISRAKPAVGHYAFTTLRPNLGRVKFDDVSVIVADIPGLIKGAHENRGLGHAFLRHIERTKVLAYVVDLASGTHGRKGLPPWEQLRDLVLELEHHQEGLSARPSLVVANKIDETGAEDAYEELKRKVQGVPIYPVCAVLDEGIPDLKEGLRMLVNGEKSHRLSLDKIAC